MNPSEKRFVKYTFNNAEQNHTIKPRDNYKEKQHNPPIRSKRYVSYTEKSSLKPNVLKDMINSYVQSKKPSQQILDICKTYPKYFNTLPKQPQPLSNESLNNYLVIHIKKTTFENKNYQTLEVDSEQDPNWDSNSDIEGGIESKKINSSIVEKMQEKLGSIKPLRNSELKRHEKQFLEDFYREKHQEELENEEKLNQIAQENKKLNSKEQIDNTWTEYQEKQVQTFVNMGFIQKIDQNQEEDVFGSEDFSVEDEKSQKEQSVKAESSEEEDDVFGDVGPSTIVKKQQAQQIDKNSKKFQADTFHQGGVFISSHIFSRIAQKVGIPPGACIWIIKNKNQRYKVTTQFMDQMYRLNNFCGTLPYISLNHSEFVHNQDVEKERGLSIFRNFNARRHQYHNQNNGNNNNNYYKSYRDNKRKFHSKNVNNNCQKNQSNQNNSMSNGKTHLNKK